MLVSVRVPSSRPGAPGWAASELHFVGRLDASTTTSMSFDLVRVDAVPVRGSFPYSGGPYIRFICSHDDETGQRTVDLMQLYTKGLRGEQIVASLHGESV